MSASYDILFDGLDAGSDASGSDASGSDASGSEDYVIQFPDLAEPSAPASPETVEELPRNLACASARASELGIVNWRRSPASESMIGALARAQSVVCLRYVVDEYPDGRAAAIRALIGFCESAFSKKKRKRAEEDLLAAIRINGALGQFSYRELAQILESPAGARYLDVTMAPVAGDVALYCATTRNMPALKNIQRLWGLDRSLYRTVYDVGEVIAVGLSAYAATKLIKYLLML